MSWDMLIYLLMFYGAFAVMFAVISGIIWCLIRRKNGS